MLVPLLLAIIWAVIIVSRSGSSGSSGGSSRSFAGNDNEGITNVAQRFSNGSEEMNDLDKSAGCHHKEPGDAYAGHFNGEMQIFIII